MDELEILPGVVEACAILRRLRFELIGVTNQPDVARGQLRRAAVEEINAWLIDQLRLDEIRTCFHDDGDRCVCRKPEPGLLLQAADDRDIELAHSYLVGDRWRDIEAGKRAGVVTILVDNGLTDSVQCEPDHRVPSLLEAAHWIEKRLG